MNKDEVKNYFGVRDFGNKKVITSGFNDIQNIMEINELSDALRIQPQKKLEQSTPNELYKKYSGLLNHVAKSKHFNEEYPYSSLSPHVILFYKTLNNFVFKKPIGKIYRVEKYEGKTDYNCLACRNNYIFRDLHLIEDELYPNIKLEIYAAFKQFILNYKTNLSSLGFRRTLRTKQKAIGKKNASMKKFLEDSFQKHDPICVVSLMVYANSHQGYYGMPDSLEAFCIDDDHIKQELEIEEIAKKQAIYSFKSYEDGIVPRVFFKADLKRIELKSAHERKIRQDQRKQNYIAYTCECRDNFIERVKKEYKKILVGYVWKLEYTKTEGLYIRIYILYKESIYFSNTEFGESLGVLWKNEVTKGKGRFENKNQIYSNYGRIHFHDDSLHLDQIKESICFLANSNYFINNSFSGRKTLGKSTP